MPEAKKKNVATEKVTAKKPAEKKAATAKATPKVEASKKAPVKKAAPAKAPAPAKKVSAPKVTDEITADAIKGKGQFAIKRANDGRYMFNVHAGNTQVIASSQMYSTMKACRNGIDSVGINAPIAAVEDQTLASINEEKCPKFQIYFDKSGKYRFNLLAANGQNILACTQGYTQKSSCKNGIKSVITNAHAMIVLPSDED